MVFTLFLPLSAKMRASHSSSAGLILAGLEGSFFGFSCDCFFVFCLMKFVFSRDGSYPFTSGSPFLLVLVADVFSPFFPWQFLNSPVFPDSAVSLILVLSVSRIVDSVPAVLCLVMLVVGGTR